MYESNAYTVHDVTLSRADSDRWDAANTVDRRALIADVTTHAQDRHGEWHGHTIRLFHADGHLLAKTVLHRPLFAGLS
jgi:hypothetical protein